MAEQKGKEKIGKMAFEGIMNGALPMRTILFAFAYLCALFLNLKHLQVNIYWGIIVASVITTLFIYGMLLLYEKSKTKTKEEKINSRISWEIIIGGVIAIVVSIKGIPGERTELAVLLAIIGIIAIIKGIRDLILIKKGKRPNF